MIKERVLRLKIFKEMFKEVNSGFKTKKNWLNFKK